MKKAVSLRTMLALNACWAGLSFMWSALHPIVLPALLLNFVPEQHKNTYLGLLTFFGLLIAAVVQPAVGALSDGWSSRYGARRPWIAAGSLFTLLFLAILAWGGGLGWLIAGYISLQLSANTVQGPLQGLLRDQVPGEQLGVASSTKVLTDVLSFGLATFLAGRLMEHDTRDPAAIMLVIMAITATSAAVTILFIREAPTRAGLPPAPNSMRPHFSLNFRAHSTYWWLIGERALFLLGIYGVQAFSQYYLQDVLRVPDPLRETGDLLAAIALGLLILVPIGGWLSDKVGAKRVLYVASGLSACGTLLMLFTTDARSLPVVGSVLGAGIGLFLTSNWALANHLSPRDQAGKFLGLANLATAGSSAVARLQGPAIDLLNAARPAAWIGYKGLFVFCTACILLSMVFLGKIRGRN